ncbi:MAG: hypothetical protein KGL11_15290 [Alphaproteobacteria bacterium]|nr:hypothetical protein [Alphaproteobacteria bacterium]
MRLPIFGLALAAVPILISGGLSRAASEQAAPAPGLSPQAISHYEQMLKGLSPGTVNSLVTEAVTLLRTYSGAATNAAGLEALKQHKAELEDLKARLCSTVITC